MDIERSTFAQLIQDDRASRESKEWRGTLLDYLEKVKEDSTITKLAHSRFYDMIAAAGMYNIIEADDPRVKRLYQDEPLKVHNFFEDEFFGIERTIARSCAIFIRLRSRARRAAKYSI